MLLKSSFFIEKIIRTTLQGLQELVVKSTSSQIAGIRNAKTYLKILQLLFFGGAGIEFFYLNITSTGMQFVYQYKELIIQEL